MSESDDELPEFEDMDEQDEPLILTCWSCGNEWPSGELGYVVDDNQRLASELCTNCGMEMRTPPLKYRDFEAMAWSPDSYPAHTLSEDEVRRRLPAVNRIADRDIRDEVISLSRDAPAYFWMAPAASPMSDYHHPMCREMHGLWAHTLMLVPVIERLSETLIAQTSTDFETYHRDYALAAALLHDQRKRGPHGTRERSAVPEHDELMASVIREESDLPDALAQAVATHMGAEEWGYNGPEPATELQNLVHTADMLASTANADLRVPGPVPEELEELGLEEGDF